MPTSEELYAKANRQKARELLKKADKLLREKKDAEAHAVLNDAVDAVNDAMSDSGEPVVVVEGQ